MIHVPALRQELRLDRLQKVLPPQFNEFFKLGVVFIVFAFCTDRCYDLFTMRIGLLTVREPKCAERILVAEFEQRKRSLQILHWVSLDQQLWGYNFPDPASFAFSKSLVAQQALLNFTPLLSLQVNDEARHVLYLPQQVVLFVLGDEFPAFQ